MNLDSAALAAFRMRCWYELGDTAHDHYIQDYDQLLHDAYTMRQDIVKKLRTEFPSRKRLPAGKADTLAELLVTALLADFYGKAYDSRPVDFVGRCYAILPKVANDVLRCYLLVLLFWLDGPDQALKSQIDSLMPLWNKSSSTPEDQYVRDLYHALTTPLGYLGHGWSGDMPK